MTYSPEYRQTPEYKEKKKLYAKKYREKNKERIKEQYHSPEQTANRKTWYLNNRQRLLKRSKELRYEKHPRYLLAGIKARCMAKNIPFNITEADIIIPEVCPVLGIKMCPEDRRTQPQVDRKRPELGYVKGNVLVISARANRLKLDATEKELSAVLSYLRRIAEENLP